MTGTAEDAVGKDCAMVKEWLRWQMDEVVDALQWCFELERTDMHADLYNAYLQVDGELHYYDIVHISSSEQAALLRDAFAAKDGAPQRVRALCAYHRQFRKWYPITIDCDKSVTNIVRRELFSGKPMVTSA